VKVLKNLSILLDCGLPDVEFGVISNLKIQYFGSENESLNKHLFITFLAKKTLVVVANLAHQQVSNSHCIFQPSQRIFL
jgi:hypothetical protein